MFKFRTDSHKETEGCIKLALKQHQLRKYKEVYQANIEMIKTIIEKCNDAVNYARIYTNAKADKKMKGGYYIVLDKEYLDS